MEPVDQRLDRARRHRRDHEREAAGGLDRAQIRQPERHLLLRRLALGRGLHVLRHPHLRGGHADKRPSAHDRTQVSFPPPFWELFTTSAPGARPNRVRPPAATSTWSLHADREGAQVHVARRQRVAVHGRVAREHHRLLSYPVLGFRLYPARRQLAILLPRVRADHDPVAPVPGPRLDHNLVDAGKDAVPNGRNGQVVCGHGTDQRLLVEVEANHRLHVSVHQLVVRHAASEGVDAGQPAGAAGIEEHLGHPGGPAMPVVQAVLVGPPVDHVHVAAATVDRGAQPPAVGVEVVRRHERQAEAPGQRAVLVPGAVHRAVGEQHHVRLAVAGRGGRAQRGSQRLEGRRQRPPRGRRRAGKGAVHGGPRRARVGQARRRAQVVLEHRQEPVGAANEVHARHRGVGPGGYLHADHPRLEVHGRLDRALGHHARRDDRAIAVHVGGERAERPHPLRQAALHELPLRGVHHARHRIHVEGLGRGAGAEAHPELVHARRDGAGQLRRGRARRAASAARGSAPAESPAPRTPRRRSHRPRAGSRGSRSSRSTAAARRPFKKASRVEPPLALYPCPRFALVLWTVGTASHPP